MKSLSKKVSLLKTSKIKLRTSSKKKKRMDGFKDGDRPFLSGVVEGKGGAFAAHIYMREDCSE